MSGVCCGDRLLERHSVANGLIRPLPRQTAIEVAEDLEDLAEALEYGRHAPLSMRSTAKVVVAGQEREEPAANKPLGFSLTLDPKHPYLAERGLTAEAIEVFGLGYADRGIMAGRIAIPIHNAQGELVAYAGRWPGEPPEGEGKYKLPPRFRKSLEVYNLHRALSEDSDAPLVVVEGFFDCIAVWQAGNRHVVALMGSSLSARQEELLLSYCGSEWPVTLFFDEDEAGRNGRQQALSSLTHNCHVSQIELPEEGSQPEDLPPDNLLKMIL